MHMKYQTMNKRYPKIMYKEIFLKNQALLITEVVFFRLWTFFYWI